MNTTIRSGKDRNGIQYAKGQTIKIFGQEFGRFFGKFRYGVVNHEGRQKGEWWAEIGEGEAIIVGEHDEIVSNSFLP